MLMEWQNFRITDMLKKQYTPLKLCFAGRGYNKVEKWQKLTAGLNPNHMHIFKPWNKDVPM